MMNVINASMSARRSVSVVLATLCAAAGVLAFTVAPAQALSKRNVIGTFGPFGPGSGVFSEPGGVAVEQSSHDVYVYDASEGGRIYKFDAAGEPRDFSSSSTNVIEGVGGYGYGASEIAVVDSSSGGLDKGDIYVANGENVEIYASSGASLGTLTTAGGPEPYGVAVDPSGDVYVAFYAEEAVKQYAPATSPVTEADYTSSLSGVGEVSNIAVDSAGDVYATDFGYEVTKYPAEEFNTEGTPAAGTVIDNSEAVTALAVDPSSGGDVYIDEGSDIAEYNNPGGSRVESFGTLSGSYGVAESHESGDVYASAAAENSGVVIYGPPVVYPTVTVGAPTELHGTSVTLNGTVSPEETSVTKCVFEYGTTTSYDQSVPCSKAVPFTGDSAEAVSGKVTGLQSGTAYDYRLAATNANGTETAAGSFTTANARVEEVSVVGVSSSVAELRAQIDPLGVATSYYFQYGTAICNASPSPCTDVPAAPGEDIGAGTAGKGVARQLQGLAPSTTYYYDVVSVQGSEASAGVEHTFTTQPAGGGFTLPDERQWEMVSPANKTGSEPGSIPKEGGLIQASANGDAIAYVANGPFAAEAEPEGSRSPETTQILSTRGTAGWASQDLVTANSTGKGITEGEKEEYQFFSSDLALALVQPFPGASESFGALAEPPLSPPLEGEKGKQEKTLYLRDDAPLAPEATEAESYGKADRNGGLMQNPGFLALVTGVNAPGKEPFGGALVAGQYGGLEFQGATPDLSHVVFSSHRAAPGLYEWGAGGTVLQPVSVLPGQASVTNLGGPSYLGGPVDFDARHAISDDGTLVFWTHTAAGETHLYVRDTVTKETLQLDTVKSGSGAGEVKAVFQTASANGSRVFFTDTQRLTADSEAAPEPGTNRARPDLYVVELSGGAVAGSPLVPSLTDLTPHGVNGESADVVAEAGGGGVLGASEDGSYVYFVANGVLGSGAPATSAHCSGKAAGSSPGSTCDLYVRHYGGTGWEPTRFIATLSYEDLPDWDAGKEGDLGGMTSRVSADGEYLAFMSDRSLTGYDNLDVNEATVDGKPGPHADEEVFLFDAKSESLVCASCNPSGARPAGVFDGGNALSEQLLVDNPETWSVSSESGRQVDSWLAGSVPGWTSISNHNALYQSRYLSNSGRLFFDSPDRLVPAVTSVMERVYEYEPNGVGSCESQAGCVGLISSPGAEHESAFLDASENGNDVFFLTSERLVPQDGDSLGDVYDAHVCEAASPCLSGSLTSSSPPCEETPALPCKGPASTAPAFTAPASTSSAGSGNLPPPLSKPVVQSKAKPLTRVQKLAKALRACKQKAKGRRAKCEKQARKRYGPRHKGKKPKHRAGKSSFGKGGRG